MKRQKAFWLVMLLTAGAIVAGLSLSSELAGPLSGPDDDWQTKSLQAFAALEPIDTHAHVFKNDPAFVAFMARVHLHIVDILVVNDQTPERGGLEPQLSDALAVVRASHGHAVLGTTFDPYKFQEPDYGAETIKQLNRNFADGAVAVKIWKNVGMEIKNNEGKFVMPDDPIFQPIYRDIAAHHKTLIAHLAEPDSCWVSPDQKGPDGGYYKEHPEWDMYLHPDHPSKATILAARDHVLAMNPKLRVVGAHLGSMETSVDEMARHFDRYPNFAVDTAARVEYFTREPREKVRAFLIKYQDRVVYGTDLELHKTDDTQEALKEWEETYARDYRFFATDQTVDFHGRKAQGLNLPPAVVRKIFHRNAVGWIPGVMPKSK